MCVSHLHTKAHTYTHPIHVHKIHSLCQHCPVWACVRVCKHRQRVYTLDTRYIIPHSIHIVCSCSNNNEHSYTDTGSIPISRFMQTGKWLDLWSTCTYLASSVSGDVTNCSFVSSSLGKHPSHIHTHAHCVSVSQAPPTRNSYTIYMWYVRTPFVFSVFVCASMWASRMEKITTHAATAAAAVARTYTFRCSSISVNNVLDSNICMRMTTSDNFSVSHWRVFFVCMCVCCFIRALLNSIYSASICNIWNAREFNMQFFFQLWFCSLDRVMKLLALLL